MSNTNNLVEDALNGYNALPLDHEIRIFYGLSSSWNRYQAINHSFNFEYRCELVLFFTAIANAFFWPMTTTSFLPLVMAV